MVVRRFLRVRECDVSFFAVSVIKADHYCESQGLGLGINAYCIGVSGKLSNVR